MPQTIQLLQGDSFQRISEIDPGTLIAVVTDPPYGISFMNKSWDDPDALSEAEGTGDTEEDDTPAPTAGELHSFQEWAHGWLKACFEKLPTGGVIKVFGATRTFHRMAAAMEKVGFLDLHLEAWIQGQGFPKSLDVSKAIDKLTGSDGETEKAIQAWLRDCRKAKGLSKADVDRLVFGGTTRYSWVEGRGGGRANETYLPTPEEWAKLKEALDLDGRYDAYIAAAIPDRKDRFRADGGKAEEVGREEGDWGYQKDGERWDGERVITAPKSPEALIYSGWGTALKPSWEPFIVGWKP